MGAADFDLTMDELRTVVRFAADGARRSNLQRTAAFASHRAAKEVSDDTARLAALACGDAAAAAYLHPIAKASQVGHILRAAASAARVAELRTGTTDSDWVRALADRASPPVPEILRRYPEAPTGKSRVSQLMSALDSAIRERD
ncbi:exonuclease SbcC [Dietzia natronolimnaea]|uniref:Exonuclease SbcC n=1 Tax=Dietzia natronolimnaea TaxID=161920 RepID=A0A2A2WQT8_9ACTN|nr:exonuclease SbcC [Dietzia natronolimnaea]PAY23560.1 exonuclease SbcC [Dietzia natronolimnaea]